MKKLLAALRKITSKNKSLDEQLVDFFNQYIEGFDKLANETFEVASSILDFEGRKLLRDSAKLLDDFQNYHDTKKETLVEILKEHHLIDLVEKKRVVMETLAVFEYDIKQILKIYNVRAQVKVEDILLHDLAVKFGRLGEMKKLANITYKDIAYFWKNLPEEYILTY